MNAKAIVTRLNAWYAEAPRWQLMTAGVILGLLVGWAT